MNRYIYIYIYIYIKLWSQYTDKYIKVLKIFLINYTPSTKSKCLLFTDLRKFSAIVKLQNLPEQLHGWKSNF